jgi:hypothetical protein
MGMRSLSSPAKVSSILTRRSSSLSTYVYGALHSQGRLSKVAFELLILDYLSQNSIQKCPIVVEISVLRCRASWWGGRMTDKTRYTLTKGIHAWRACWHVLSAAHWPVCLRRSGMTQPQTWLLLIPVPACLVSRYTLTVNRQFKGLCDNRTGDNKASRSLSPI